MSDEAERVKGSIPPESSVRVNQDDALESLEYAVQALSQNAEFAREMAARARSAGDDESAAEFEREVTIAERHAANISTLAGSLRLINQLHRPRRSRAA